MKKLFLSAAPFLRKHLITHFFRNWFLLTVAIEVAWLIRASWILGFPAFSKWVFSSATAYLPLIASPIILLFLLMSLISPLALFFIPGVGHAALGVYEALGIFKNKNKIKGDSQVDGLRF